MIQLFVYGTLKRGGRLNHLLNSAEYVTDAILDGAKMFNYHESYPIVQLGHPGSVVHGEVWNLPHVTDLHKIDRIEYDAGYTRSKELVGEAGTDLSIFVHVYHMPNLDLLQEVLRVDPIESGQWPVNVFCNDCGSLNIVEVKIPPHKFYLKIFKTRRLECRRCHSIKKEAAKA